MSFLKTIHNDTRGLTFLELMVVIAIFGMIAGVVLFNFKDFTGGVNLQNTSQEIALRIMQSQRYAISGNISGGAATTPSLSVRPTYGVYFDLNGTNSTAPFNSNIDPRKQFVFFVDGDGDGVFDRNTCGAGNAGTIECLDLITINSGDYISDICINEKSGTDTKCASTGDIDMPINITFKRPFPDAHFAGLDAVQGITSGGIPVIVDDMSIKVSSLRGLSKAIIIWTTGQISVESVN